tara:strand:- start:45445 stop:46092 length:648 start_codon:yes stop_codon:yes gene_type:complete
MLDHLTRQAAIHGLTISGAFHPAPNDPILAKTLILLSPSSDFWAIFKNSVEGTDKAKNPIDRWSLRVISALADEQFARPLFPFGGPPYAPFLDWAKQSGRAFSSPLGMLVHDTYGMMISYRGALAFDQKLQIPAPPTISPCNTCADKPCLTACPVNAITDAGYNVDRCHQYLDTNAGETCMTQACQIRTACPVSVAVKRDPAHNLLHMRAFKGET